MSLYSVPEVYLRRNAKWGKFGGPGMFAAGVPRFVVPGVNASAFAFVTDTAKYVYTDVNAAYADCVDGQGDVIIPLPGAHTLTANLAWSKANVGLIGWEQWLGLPVQKPSAIITPLAATDGFTVTAADATFRGVTIVPITAKIGISFSALALRLTVTNCHFDMNVAVANVATKGLMPSGAAVDTRIEGNYFYSLGAHGPFATVTGLINYTIRNNDFVVLTGGTMASGILVGAAAQGLIHSNRFYGGTQTAAIDGTGATVAASCRIFENRFGVLCTVPIDNFSATNLTDLALNYVATVGGGTGGTLVSVNT
jgi:hypothetical protein